MKHYTIPILPLTYDLETIDVLKQLNRSNRKLAELRGVAQTIPNEAILINTLALQEAKDSSEVENIITTQDDLFKADLNMSQNVGRLAEKEVLNYREALLAGFKRSEKKAYCLLTQLRIFKAIWNTTMPDLGLFPERP